MYLNRKDDYMKILNLKVKPGHEMYLNLDLLVRQPALNHVKPGHEMYLNKLLSNETKTGVSLNQDMRCI